MRRDITEALAAVERQTLERAARIAEDHSGFLANACSINKESTPTWPVARDIRHAIQDSQANPALAAAKETPAVLATEMGPSNAQAVCDALNKSKARVREPEEWEGRWSKRQKRLEEENLRLGQVIERMQACATCLEDASQALTIRPVRKGDENG